MKNSNQACRYEGEVSAYVSGELTPPARTTLEAHLEACATCRQALSATRQTLAALRTVAPVEPSGDPLPGILARLQEPPAHRGLWHTPPAWPRLAAAAAAAALLLLGLWTFQARIPGRTDDALRTSAVLETEPAGVLDEAVRWLCRAQAPDGAWSAAQWGGNPQFDVALTALAMLALSDADPDGAEALGAIRRGVASLLHRQSPEGDFGSDAGVEAYNHGMATLALLRARGRLPDSRELDAALDRAIARIRLRQTPQGGWGYRGADDSVPTLSVTVWHAAALRQAVDQDWTAAQADLQRALHWIAATGDDHGLFGYRRARDFPEGANALTAMGASILLATDALQLPPERLAQIRQRLLQATHSPRAADDYYRNYFLAAAIKAMSGGEDNPLLASLRERVADRRETGKTEPGSWPPDDRWSGTGGRVYATAMAVMALN